MKNVINRAQDGQRKIFFSFEAKKRLFIILITLMTCVCHMFAKTVYCKAPAWWTTDGAVVGIYAWGDGVELDAGWPGVVMNAVENEEGVFAFDLDDKYTHCVFTRGAQKNDAMEYWYAKTEDLAIPSDKDLYTITSETATWDPAKVTGEWYVLHGIYMIKIQASPCDAGNAINVYTSTEHAVVSATPNYGYHFVHWNDNITENPRAIELTQDTSFTAIFEPDTFSLNVTCEAEYGIIENGTGEYPYGSNVTFSAQSKYGYEFRRWSDNNINNPRTVSIKENITLSAIFFRKSFDVYGTYSPYGSISGVGSYLYENYCTISANPNYGYHFTQWSDGVTDNPRTFTLTQDTSFTAEFAKNTYVISTESSNSEWGTTAGDKSALYLEDVEISAKANYGYHFVKWDDGNKQNPRVISVVEDKTYIATFAKNIYSIKQNAEHGSISGPSQAEYLEEISLTAIADYGYHFTQWSDGVIDNPRTFTLTQDTTFTAEFAKNKYTITTESSNLEWGTTAGDADTLYLDEVEISAIANYGYHFVKWDDGNKQNPRVISVVEDKTYIATFAKNIYSIKQNAEHGSISGPSQAEYLEEISLTAIADYGYHFTQWSDGITDNPRLFTLTQDTTFTAEFDIDKSGKCGDNLALAWEYDATNKVLTISGNGTLNSNYTFGLEAPTAVEKLVIAEGITTIGNSAFAGYATLKYLSVASSVKTIYEQAFYNCTGLEYIYCYRKTPPTAYSNTFDGIEKFECVLHVLSASVDMYKAATGWRDFYYIKTIDAEEVTEQITDVKVEPTDNTVEVTWPIEEQAATYTLEIAKDGVLFCTLVFNANGQLTGIVFAPSRNGSNHQAPAALKTSNGGLRFTVTGLDSDTKYHLTVNAKDAGDQVIATYNSNFTTTGVATSIDQTSQEPDHICNTQKLLINGQILILRGSHTYTLTGQELK